MGIAQLNDALVDWHSGLIPSRVGLSVLLTQTFECLFMLHW